MTKPNTGNRFVGIQASPISFVDEGVDNVLETLQNRVGVNVLMLGTVSWLGLKSGRSISHELDGWPDHGVPEPYQMRGGEQSDGRSHPTGQDPSDRPDGDPARFDHRRR